MSKAEGLLFFSGFVTAFFLTLLYSLWRKATRLKKISQIAKTAEHYVKGEWNQSVLIGADIELRLLVRAMNKMASSLKARVAEAESERAKLSAVLAHMEEGVIAVDRTKGVVMMNPSAERMFGLPASASGKSLIEVVRDKKIDEMMDHVMLDEVILSEEIEFSGNERKALKVNAIGLPQGEGVCGILVFYDISTVRKLENIRREFVANVSHELKTPLTSLQGFIETLLDGVFRNAERSESFLKMMQEDASRLARLIDELLELSKIESHQIELNLELLSIPEELEKALAAFEKPLREKNIGLENHVSRSGIPFLLADRDRLRQIFLNLLDNAVKFNKEGGKIIIHTVQSDGHVKISIEDTGIGIPESSIPRVFERFYRVDKARSKEMGGTGLGLSIVKHLVELQGGRVYCESQIGKGSTFSFTLPITPTAPV